jgi:hypothetical protein
MASIPVTIQGVMTYSDVGVGGGPMPGGPGPAHPIAPGGAPPEVWPGPGAPTHPIAPGGGPAHPIVIPPDAISPGVPSHPIYLPPPTPGHPIFIPPDAIAPGVPSHPIVLPPPTPGHPIVIPPDAISPGVPAHPIELPPEGGSGAQQSFTIAVRNNATGETKVVNFVPGDPGIPPAQPPTTPGPKTT